MVLVLKIKYHKHQKLKNVIFYEVINIIVQHAKKYNAKE